jgi:hypothetical protein
MIGESYNAAKLGTASAFMYAFIQNTIQTPSASLDVTQTTDKYWWRDIYHTSYTSFSMVTETAVTLQDCTKLAYTQGYAERSKVVYEYVNPNQFVNA